jgi:integrase
MSKGKKKSGVAFFERTSWYHRVKTLQEDGTVKYGKKGGFATEKEAEESYWKLEEEFLKQQRAYQVSKQGNPDISLKDYLIFWFENVYSMRVETTTRMLGAYTLYDLLLPSMESDIKMRYLSAEYLDNLLERAARMCASAGNQGRSFLGIALKDACRDDYISYNPFSETKSYPRRKPNVQILNKSNLKKFLQAASQDGWYLEILLALFCGLRKGEILGLKYDDFDLEQHTVHITRQLVANPIIRSQNTKVECPLIEREPKTENSLRILRVPDVVFEELEKRRKQQEIEYAKMEKTVTGESYVSCSKDSTPHSLSAMNIALGKLCKRNGLPHLTVHGLRHMFATILIENGVPLVKISGLLGHNSIHTTFEYYCDVMDEKGKIIAFMNDRFPVERTGTEG